MTGLESIFIQGLFKLTLALIGIIIGRLTLVCFDRLLPESNFTEWLNGANDEAKAQYYAGRFIGIAIIIGLAIG